MSRARRPVPKRAKRSRRSVTNILAAFRVAAGNFHPQDRPTDARPQSPERTCSFTAVRSNTVRPTWFRSVARQNQEGPGRLLRQSLPDPMFMPQSMRPPTPEGTPPIMRIRSESCVPRYSYLDWRPESHARTAAATASRSAFRLWSPGTFATSRVEPGGGMPNRSRSPWTTSVGTFTASSSSRRL